jgi:hypothetical protein
MRPITLPRAFALLALVLLIVSLFTPVPLWVVLLVVILAVLVGP